MTEWRKVKLGDICETQYGYTASAETVDTGTKFLRITDIVPETIDWDSVPFCKISNEDRAKYILRKGDIVVARTGATVGYAKYIKNDVESVFASYLVRFKVIDNLADKEYVGLCVTSKAFKDYILSIANGSAQPNANSQMMSSFELALPSLTVQRRIAEVLSRYDALIENYQRQIKLLEEAAQRLYKEWFVDLRFPGHQSTPIINNLPQSWQKKTAKDFFTMSIGKTPPRAESGWFSTDDKDVPWVSISDMKDVMFVNITNERLTHEACDHFNVKIVPEGTILLSFKLTVGRVSIADKPVCTNEAIAHFMRDGDKWREYTLMYLRNYHYDSLGNTSGISKAVNSTIIKNMPFVMPSNDILDGFSKMSSPIINQIRNLSTQIRNLSEARDRLLPKLMSAEIDV